MNRILKLIFNGGDTFAGPFHRDEAAERAALSEAQEQLDELPGAAANDPHYSLQLHVYSWA